MDTDETRRQVIALLTATYTTLVREGGTDFVEMTGPLLNDLLSISFDFDITYTGNIEGFAHAVAEQTARELQPKHRSANTDISRRVRGSLPGVRGSMSRRGCASRPPGICIGRTGSYGVAAGSGSSPVVHAGLYA